MNNTDGSAYHEVKADIETNFPDFRVQNITFAGEGFDHRAFEVNGTHIFRFPKYADVAERLEVEIALLPRLQDHVDVAIPHFEYIGHQSESGFPFAGYKKIRGITLEGDLLLKSNQRLRTELAGRIGHLLQQIHSFPMGTARQCGIEVNDFKSDYAEDFEILQHRVYPLVDLHVQEYMEALVTAYLGDDENFCYTPALLHADLGPEHIIFDEEKCDVVGIIDFGDVIIGDPDYDLMYLYEYYGKGFIGMLLSYYPHRDEVRLMRKLPFFCECNTLVDVLIGIDRKDDKIFRESMEKLKQQARRWSGRNAGQ